MVTRPGMWKISVARVAKAGWTMEAGKAGSEKSVGRF